VEVAEKRALFRWKWLKNVRFFGQKWLKNMPFLGGSD
jgi:hypothetical protein